MKHIYTIKLIIAVVTSCIFTTGLVGFGYPTTEIPFHTTQANTASVDNSKSAYEAIFLDNIIVTKLFKEVRGEKPPHKKVTKNFHVTTEYKPQTMHSNLYGSEINVHIIKYKDATIKDDNNKDTNNDGFGVELWSENAEMQKLLDSYNVNWHITDSFDLAAKYTNKIDFSNGKDLDYTIKGKFGTMTTDGKIITEPI